MDVLEPDMIGMPFIVRVQEKGLNSSIRAGWSSEISGTYWTGLVQLAFTLVGYPL